MSIQSSVATLMQNCMQNGRHWVSSLAFAAMDFIYPPACHFCGADVDSFRDAFCDSCKNRLKPELTNECPRCGAPTGLFVNLKDGCGQCSKESFAFDRLIRLGVYDGEMR